MCENHVHVVGTGTIGGPLIRYLTELREPLGIDRLTFAKARPLPKNRHEIGLLTAGGASLVVQADRVSEFEQAGYLVNGTVEEALPTVTHLVDCTPKGKATAAKAATYGRLMSEGRLRFAAAQGSEKGFGKPYAHGINDAAMTEDDRWVMVVSCNTHGGAFFIDGVTGGDPDLTEWVLLDYVRRASDVIQDGGHELSVKVEIHKGDAGTHQARDIIDLYATLGGRPINGVSSASVVPTQLMHGLVGHILLRGEHSVDQVIDRLKANGRIALTHKLTTAEVFGFGRDWGGRILNPLVVVVPTLHAVPFPGGTLLTGWMFIPQDANSHWSTLAILARKLRGEVGVRIVDQWARRLIHSEI